MAGYLGATPRQGAQLQRNTTQIKPNATVESRLTGLLGQDSAYMRQAEGRGRQAAAAQGMLNSSMAVGAAEQARISAAMPIAQQDANTFASAAMQDSAYRQQGGLNQQNYQNSAFRADQDFGNNRSLQAQGIEGQSRLAREGFGYDTQLSAQGYRQNRGLQAQQGDIQGNLIDRQGNVNSRLQRENFGYDTRLQAQGIDGQSRIAREGFGYDTRLQAQGIRGQQDLSRQNFGQNRVLQGDQFGYDTRLQGQQIRGQRDLAGDQYGYNRGLQAQQGDINRTQARDNFGYNTQLTDQQGRISSDLSAQEYGQDRQLNQDQINAQRENQSREIAANMATNTQNQIAAIQSNPDLSPAQRATAIQNVQRHNANATTVMTRGTQLAGNDFVYGGLATVPRGPRGTPGQPMTRPGVKDGPPPSEPPGEGYRWQQNRTTNEWVRRPIVG